MLMLTDLLFVVGADLWLKWRSERRFTYLRTCIISAGVALCITTYRRLGTLEDGLGVLCPLRHVCILEDRTYTRITAF
jgi:hypothetical protein